MSCNSNDDYFIAKEPLTIVQNAKNLFQISPRLNSSTKMDSFFWITKASVKDSDKAAKIVSNLTKNRS